MEYSAIINWNSKNCFFWLTKLVLLVELVAENCEDIR